MITLIKLKLQFLLLWHLASNAKGSEVEWQAPYFKEKKNFIWLMKSTKERVERLSEQFKLSEHLVNETHLKITQPMFYFLPLAASYAVLRGQVALFKQIAEELLISVSIMLNDPSRRITWECSAEVARTDLIKANRIVRRVSSELRIEGIS